VTNSANMNHLKSICLVESSRPLAYNKTKEMLMLSSEVQGGDDYDMVETNVKESFGSFPMEASVCYKCLAL
jgi:hypothetical protein